MTVKIQVKEIARHRDGGTTVYVDKNSINYFEDYRLFTKTPGVIYDKYPDKSDAIILDVELIKVENF